MKKIIVSIAVLLFSAPIYAQSEAGNVTVQNATLPAVVLELNYAPDLVSDALNDYLSRKGRSKREDIKGFTTYRNTQAVQGDSVNADLYFKIERKSRKEKQVTVVSLLLNKPAPDAVASNSNLHYLTMEQAKAYLNGLVATVDAYDLDLKIKDQNKSVVAAETKLKHLADEGGDLENKKVSIEKKIDENKAQQQSQVNEVTEQKHRLEMLVARRKS
jgi:hypothetical protein